ncbi:MAG TPA: hypothetical protein VIH98_16455 [Xanthobacteraceae bacterium]
MEDAIQLYRTLLGNRAYVRSVCEGAVFLAASTIAIFAAVTYTTVHASNYVTDLVLSRVGPFNVRFGAIPSPQEGRIAIVTDVGCGMRWT